MNFTGNENHDIPLSEAAEWTANYRATVPTGTVIAHYFGKEAIKAIFDQNGCVGMRVYYAIDGSGAKQLIICGVKDNLDDIYDGLLADRNFPCPAACGALNPLNS